MSCETNINVPTTDNTVPSCLNPTSTDCVFYEAVISYLSLPAMSSTTTVINALVSSLMNARTRITTLESIVEDFETRISALEG